VHGAQIVLRGAGGLLLHVHGALHIVGVQLVVLVPAHVVALHGVAWYGIMWHILSIVNMMAF
jgi:hypothetical protein